MQLHNALMRIAPSAAVAHAVAELSVDACERDTPRIAIPRPEVQLVVRFGPMTRDGVDVHAFGARQRAHRKLIRGGQSAVTVRLQLGATEAVLGVPARTLAGRIVTLDEIWGEASARRLLEELARSPNDAVATVQRVIAERLATHAARPGRELVARAAERLATANVNEVADDLGVSERHLRRVFRDAIGLSPKEFAKLTRFHRALRAARDGTRRSWSSIAAATGYYDQAHLIDDFRAIAGVTPRALLGELAG
jgi:AraC-like DNA-binding protein